MRCEVTPIHTVITTWQGAMQFPSLVICVIYMLCMLNTAHLKDLSNAFKVFKASKFVQSYVETESNL